MTHPSLSRRVLLSTGAASLTMPALHARAAGKTVRMGFQKGEPVLLAARQNQDLGKLLAPLGWNVEWIEFQFGPPMLEAMRVGSVDLGAVGDTPPIFAQAARGDLLYVSGLRAGEQAILLPAGSTIKTLTELKGRKLAFGRGSSAHNFAVRALEQAGLRYDEIEPVYLGPADAGAAFTRGAIDAWSIWDPYYALFENRSGVRTLISSKDLGTQNSFFMSWAPFARSNPELLAKLMEGITASAAWVRSHRDEVAQLLAGSTGMPPDVMRRAIARLPAELVPMSADLTESQQRVADRFRALGLLPVEIKVAETVWRPNA